MPAAAYEETEPEHREFSPRQTGSGLTMLDLREFSSVLAGSGLTKPRALARRAGGAGSLLATYIRAIEPQPPVLVVGAGGHALVAIDVLWATERTVLGCVSNDGRAGAWLPVEMLGRTTDAARLAARQQAEVFVAVSDNYARQKAHAELSAAGLTLVTAVSPAAVVAASARLGPGTLVMPGAVVNAQSEIGEGVIVGSTAVVDHECRVGEFSHLGPRTVLAGRAILGRGVFVGAGASIVPQVTVGDWAVVGAGAAVTASVPAGTTVVGVPARVWTDQ